MLVTQRSGRGRTQTLGLGLALALVTVACNSAGTSGTASAGCGIERGGRCRPAAERVDLVKPKFSNPTNITNPLFPTSKLDQVIQIGNEAGEPSRVEITRLPRTKTIEWNGQRVATLVRQFIAYADRRVVEVALDYLAQADDGSVWYFGEDVSNYEDGVVADRGGTWLAGKAGPAGMIMPADPKVGDVYRPENIPKLVFEEVTVQSTGETVDAPTRRVHGAIRTREHLMENTYEGKTFAPGYGEFEIRASDELARVAVAVPPDAVGGGVPAALRRLRAGATDLFDAAESAAWNRAASTLSAMNASWSDYDSGKLPTVLARQMRDALDRLDETVGARDIAKSRQGALDVALAALDLQLRYRAPADVDIGRLETWARQLVVDAAAHNAAGVSGDVATLQSIRERVAHTWDARTSERVDSLLGRLRRAADDKDLGGAAGLIPALLERLRGLEG